MRARYFFLLISLALGCCATQAQVVSYTFGTSSTPSTGATILDPNVSASAFASNVGGGTTGSSSPTSATAGGGGGAYFTASNWRASDDNYFYFTLTPTSGNRITLTDFSFYYAATGSGPSSASLSSSADNYSSVLASFSLTRQAGGSLLASDWHAANSSITLSAITSATIFRFSATGASGATGSLRIDAVTLNGTVSAVPEPSVAAVFGGVSALLAVLFVRRNKKSPAAIAEDS